MQYCDQPISKLFGLRAVKGDIGIEVELEYDRNTLPVHVDSGNWRSVEDGSLRHGAEYKLVRPIRAENIEIAVDALYSKLPIDQLRLSPRTSVHVHLNVTGMTLRTLLNLYSGYLLYENMLFSTQVGRKANHFCLRTLDAEAPYNSLLNALKYRNVPIQFGNDEHKYSGFNFCSIPRYGSVEYRFLSGIKQPDQLKFWASSLYHMSTNLSNITTQDQIELASTGIEALSEKALPPDLAKVLHSQIPKLSEREKISGLEYAMNLAAILDTKQQEVEEAKSPYIFNPTPDIDRGNRKKPKVRVENDWNDPFAGDPVVVPIQQIPIPRPWRERHAPGEDPFNPLDDILGPDGQLRDLWGQHLLAARGWLRTRPNEEVFEFLWQMRDPLLATPDDLLGRGDRRIKRAILDAISNDDIQIFWLEMELF